jgi:hypothetical protein
MRCSSRRSPYSRSRQSDTAKASLMASRLPALTAPERPKAPPRRREKISPPSLPMEYPPTIADLLDELGRPMRKLRRWSACRDRRPPTSSWVVSASAGLSFSASWSSRAPRRSATWPGPSLGNLPTSHIWVLTDISVLSKFCYGRSLSRDKAVIWGMSASYHKRVLPKRDRHAISAVRVRCLIFRPRLV